MKRAEYSRRIAKYLPEERVYVDESRFDRRTATRTKAWSLAGSRSLKTVFFLRGFRYVLSSSTAFTYSVQFLVYRS